MPPQYHAQGQTAPLAIAALVLGIASLIPYLGCLTCIPAIVCGILAIRQIKANPGLGGKGMAIAGIVLGCFLMFVALLGTIAALVIPNMMQYQNKANEISYDLAAQAAGHNAILAEEAYFQSTMGNVDGGYTNKLSNLLVAVPDLNSDPDVMWSFGDCNSQGYTYTTWHNLGTGEKYVFTEAGQL